MIRRTEGPTREVVVVTGANAGIGFHLTQDLLRRRYRVAGLDLATDRLTPLLATYSQQLHPIACDVTRQPQVDQAVKSIIDQWGRIDILVNNAVLVSFDWFERKPLEQTRRELEVNYFGYLHMIRAVLPQMKAQGSGIIHNVSSGVGLTGFPGIYGYCSSKGAIEALSRTLRLELKQYGVAVTVMHPPLTNTASAAPLGIPARAMADPAVVGRKLARRIGSRSPVVTPDVTTSFGLWVSRCFPTATGRLMARMTERVRKAGA